MKTKAINAIKRFFFFLIGTLYGLEFNSISYLDSLWRPPLPPPPPPPSLMMPGGPSWRPNNNVNQPLFPIQPVRHKYPLPK